MANTHGYEFFMQEVDSKGNLVPNTLVNLEEDFYVIKVNPIQSNVEIDPTPHDIEVPRRFLSYIICTAIVGINNLGAVKNIYTETYADANRVRVSMPEKVQRESTQVTLVLYFVGEKRADVFKKFCDYICNGKHRYWDTARNKYFDFYISEELTPSDELWYGSTPYFKVDVKMNNIFGQTFDSHEDVEEAYNE